MARMLTAREIFLAESLAEMFQLKFNFLSVNFTAFLIRSRFFIIFFISIDMIVIKTFFNLKSS